MAKEEWKSIKGYEGRYKISSNGKVYSLISNKELKGYEWGNNIYRMVGLHKDKKSKQFSIHRLVATAFLGEPNIDTDQRIEVNHKNGIKTDNRVGNLEWCTHGENQSHAYWLGLKPNVNGENHPRARFKNNFVKKVQEEHKSGCKRRELIKRYGLTISQIDSFLYGHILNLN